MKTRPNAPRHRAARYIGIALMALVSGCAHAQKEVQVDSIYDIAITPMSGEPFKLEAYRGKTLLIVNTASKCGFTKQYEGLQQLHETYADRGLVIIGFPSNDFWRQEPGTNEEIASFCQLNYGVTFLLSEKTSVNGGGQHELYAYLTSKQTNPEHGGKISWNFNKFLISPEGEVVARYGSKIKPDSKKMIAAIEQTLEVR